MRVLPAGKARTRRVLHEWKKIRAAKSGLIMQGPAGSRRDEAGLGGSGQLEEGLRDDAELWREGKVDVKRGRRC